MLNVAYSYYTLKLHFFIIFLSNTYPPIYLFYLKRELIFISYSYMFSDFLFEGDFMKLKQINKFLFSKLNSMSE